MMHDFGIYVFGPRYTFIVSLKSLKQCKLVIKS